MVKLSIIIPCRDEEENINIMYENILKKIAIKDYEIIFINDHSQDNTEKNIKNLTEKDDKVKLLNNKKKA